MRLMHDPLPDAKGGWAFYFDKNRDQVNCRIDPADLSNPPGVQIHIGISDLYAQTCDPRYIPGTTVAEYTGPVVPFVLSTLATSPEQAISAQAAHLIFGNGGLAPLGSGMKDATPWTDYTRYYIKNASGGSVVLTSLLIDVPKNQFWGIDRGSTENLRDSLLVSNTNSSIGILSIDSYDKNRGNLKALFLQAKDQRYGYLPDSTPTTIDKVNVRDGHYPLWGYVHFFAPMPPGGTDPAANAMVLLFNPPRIDQPLVDDIIQASLTPQCAMTVARTSEMGDFMPRPGFQCGCYFDLKTKRRTDCTTCVTAEDCPGQHPCNYGYCELNDN